VTGTGERPRLAVLSGGIWQQRDLVAAATGGEPVRYRWPLASPAFDAVVGWGRKETATRAMALAARAGVPYLALEDGFLRSVRPGAQTRALSLVVDRTGIYYDATRPSDLEGLIATAAAASETALAEARTGMERLRVLRLSKYNDGLERTPGELGLPGAAAGGFVLVVDQTWNDASIRYGMADAASFERMLRAALSENPGATVVVKTHPDVVAGRKRGYLGHLPGDIEARDRARVRIVADPVVPWVLTEAASRVYVVTSQLGFEALLAGKPVTCFGAPFYAGWGLTDDRVTVERRHARPSLAALFKAACLDYPRYFCPYRGTPIDFPEALERLAFLRDHHRANAVPTVCYKITLWKRKVIGPLLDGAGGPPTYARLDSRAVAKAAAKGGRVAVWASRCTPGLERRCREAGVPLTRIEDGFIRSVGLGARYIRGASIAVDEEGIYYDPSRPSALETILESAEMPPELLVRARRLREEIARLGLTKYNVGATGSLAARLPNGPFLLVPGQVADDASILSATSESVDLRASAGPNVALLAAVRARNPDAFVLYKPHPDVVAGLRKGKVAEREARRYADLVLEDVSIVPLLERCARVETLTSLTGFEALLRGKPVTVHGLPFYAGWGLTDDTTRSARRTRRRSLDELVAGALILYPRYIDLATSLPCPVERVLDTLGKQLGEAGRGRG
jgi:capsular polysaccharide export protein